MTDAVRGELEALIFGAQKMEKHLARSAGLVGREQGGQEIAVARTLVRQARLMLQDAVLEGGVVTPFTVFAPEEEEEEVTT